MEEDKLMMLANVAFWLSEKENRIKQINHRNSKKRNLTALTIGDSFTNHASSSSSSLGSVSFENKPSKRPKLVLSLSTQNGDKEVFVLGSNNDNNSTESWLSGVARKKRTSMVRRRRNPPIIRAQNPPIESLEDRIRAAGGEELRLVVEKSLTLTDLSSDHGRLSMPKSTLRSTFLRGNEASRVRGRSGLWVPVVDEGGREYNLRLRQWMMANGPIFNLNGGWNALVADNPLSEKDLVQLWSFRRASRLCFAFVKPRD